MQAQFQIGYQGLMELAYRSKKVKSISAHCIYESETHLPGFYIKRIDGKTEVNHPFSFEEPTGDMVAVYATARLEDLDTHTVVLRKSQVERFRQLSKAPNSPAWKNHYEAMAKKTAIRQLAKFLPKSIADDLTRGAAIDEQQDFAESQSTADIQKDAEAGSEIVDANFEPEGQAEQPQQGENTEQKQEESPQTKQANQPQQKDSGLYLCFVCGHRFNEAPKEKDGKWQCPKCGKLHVTRTPF
jgi:recombination protein RecT